MMEHYIEVGTDDSIAAFAQILYRMPPPLGVATSLASWLLADTAGTRLEQTGSRV